MSRLWSLGAIGFLLSALTGADVPTPKIVPIRVPAARVKDWFPTGTPLRGLSYTEFESLLDTTRNKPKGVERLGRVVAANHKIRWVDGVLLGGSELTVELAQSGPSLIPLSPWSPSLLTRPPEVVSLNDGRTALLLVPDVSGTTTVTLDWSQRARPESSGQSFALGLPGEGLARLTLDLPESLTPEDLPGTLATPAPASLPGRRNWIIEGSLGQLDLKLRPTSSAAPLLIGGPSLWTFGRASATWKADWVVERRESGPRRLAIELDPGLELLSATGPRVVSSRIERVEGRSRLVIRFDPETRGPTSLTLQGMAQVPVTGDWTIPTARPLDSIWTGGQTTVRLDAGRTLLECRELAGRRLTTRQERGATPLVVLESNALGSVATLTFGSPVADAWADIRGRVQVGSGRDRATTTIQWTLTRGVPLVLSVDLPTGWTPEHVERIDGTRLADWKTTSTEAGGFRLEVTPPPDLIKQGKIELVIIATADRDVNQERWSPPRIRPSEVRIADERWVLGLAEGLKCSPNRARGLTWIDPKQLGEPRPNDALAWRWLDDFGDLEIALARVLSSPTWTTKIDAHVARESTTIEVELIADLGKIEVTKLPIISNVRVENEVTWRLEEVPNGPSVISEPTASGWILTLPQPRQGSVRLIGRWSQPSTSGSLPLLFPGNGRLTQGRVHIHVDPDILMSSGGQGMVPLDPRSEGIEAEATTTSTFLGYDSPNDQLTLQIKPLTAITPQGIINEAVLTTTVDPSGPTSRHRLRLAVLSGTLNLTLPEGVMLESVSVDGRPVTPVLKGRGLTLPLGSVDKPVTRLVTLEFTEKSNGHTRIAPWPISTLPILTRRWELVLPEPWNAVPNDSRWVEAEVGQLGVWERLVSFFPQREPTYVPSIAANDLLDRPLGELFTEWDQESFPFVIDRLALASAGWSPSSRLKPSSTRDVIGRLRDSGLELRGFGKAVLVTTTLEPTAVGWEPAIRTAISKGSDALDRLQTVDRWVSTPSLAELASGTSGVDPRPGPGWRVVRFVPATSTGDAPAVITLVDPRIDEFRRLYAGIMVLTGGVLLRRSRRKPRILGLAVVLLASLSSLFLDVESPISSGLVWGGLGVGLLWAGMARARSLPARPSESSSTHRRPRVTPGSLIGLSLLPLILGAELVGPVAPIWVLFPYDEVPLARETPTRAILKLADFERLQSISSGTIESTFPAVVATRVEHSAGVPDGTSLEFVTDWALRVVSPGSWSFPIVGSHDLTMTINGKPASVEIDPGGATGRVWFESSGTFQVRLKRQVETKPNGSQGRLARVLLVPSSFAIMTVAQDDPLPGLPHLGPVDHFDMTWGSAPIRSVRDYQGLMLWDAEPAGDRLRVRLRAVDGQPVTELRLGIEAGVILRSLQHPGKLVSDSIKLGADGNEWIGHFEHSSTDPGVSKPIELEFWRPITSGTGPRRGPGLELRGGGNLSGMLALRRPSDWTGRLTGPSPFGIAPDFEFVRAWGELPSEPLTLAGVVRFKIRADVAATLGPTPSRHLARSELQIILSRGRADWRLETKLTTVSGSGVESDITIDPKLHLFEVEAPGLTHWSRPRPDRLRLRFDAATVLAPTVRLSGWLPVDGPELTIRWPRFDTAADEPGHLSIVAGFPVNVEGTGLKRESKDVYQLTYFDEPIRLRFDIPSTRFDVLARSVLRIEPQTQEWISVLDYTFLDGPADSIPIQLPAIWANEVRAELDGVAISLEPFRDAAQSVKVLRPVRPLWSHARVVVRGRRPRSAGEPMFVPELTPLGTGELRALVGVANVSGETLATPETRGLQALEATKFGIEETTPFDRVDLVWAVQPLASWSLELSTEPTPLAPVVPEVSHVDVTAVSDHFDHIRGVSTCWLKPGSKGWLRVKFPTGVMPTTALIEGEPTPIWSGDGDSLLIEIPSPRITRLAMMWDGTSGSNGPLKAPDLANGRSVSQTYIVFHPSQVRMTPALDTNKPHLVTDEQIRTLADRVIELASRPRRDLDVVHLLDNAVARLRLGLLRPWTSESDLAAKLNDAKKALKLGGWDELSDLLEMNQSSAASRVAAMARVRSDPSEYFAHFGLKSSTIVPPDATPPRLERGHATTPEWSDTMSRWWGLGLVILVAVGIRLWTAAQPMSGVTVIVILLIASIGLASTGQNAGLAVVGGALWLTGRLARD